MGKDKVEEVMQSTAFDLLENLKSDDNTEGLDVDQMVSLFPNDPTVSSPESYSSTSLDEDDDLVVKTDDTLFKQKVNQPTLQVKQEPGIETFSPQPLNDFVASFLESEKKPNSGQLPTQQPVQQKQANIFPFTGFPNLGNYYPQIIPMMNNNSTAIPPNPTIKMANKPMKVEEEDKLETKRKKLKRRREHRQPDEKKEGIKEENCPQKAKEIKRQKRLIKNRESAQASRERKKLYVQGLEKKISELNTKSSTLSSKLLSLEEENKILREQLQKAIRGEKIEEPIPKKRKLNAEIYPQNVKLPLPPMSYMSIFGSNFWGQVLQQQSKKFPGKNGSQIVLFVMLFCVGVFMLQTGINFENNSTLQFVKKQSSESIELKRPAGRVLLSSDKQAALKGSDKPQTEVAKEIESLHELVVQILKLVSENNNITKKASEMKEEKVEEKQWKELQDLFGKISFGWDADKQNVMIKFPLKDEKKTEDNDQQELKNVVAVSKNLLSEICTRLTKVY